MYKFYFITLYTRKSAAKLLSIYYMEKVQRLSYMGVHCKHMAMEIRRLFMKKLSIDKEELIDLYLNQQLSTRDVAKILNVGQTSVRRYLKKYNIRERTSAESKDTNTYKEKMFQYALKYKEEYSKRAIEEGHRIFKICPVCGKEFSRRKSQESTYCSMECAGIAKRKVNTCNRCGKVLDNFWAKYCPECLKQVKHELFYNRVLVKCTYCGKKLLVIPARARNSQNCYCNYECMAKDYETRFSGENSPTWKGGKKHYRGHWLKQRNLARKRDNYTCQLCGVTEEEWHKEMDVHHIRNYRKFEDKDEANKLENLVCLCNKCHSFVHSNNNTDNLFIEE